MSKSSKYFLVRQKGILKELFSVSQDSTKDKTVRISNRLFSLRSLDGNSEWTKPSEIKQNKFSIHPGDNTNPPAFIVTHTIKNRSGKTRKGYIRVNKHEKADVYFIPVYFSIIGDLPDFKNESGESAIIGDYDTDEEILFISVSASSKKLHIRGTCDIGSRFFEFEKFRIYINYVYLRGRSGIRTCTSVPYTIHPDAPKIPQQEEFSPAHISTFEFLNLGTRLQDQFSFLAKQIDRARDPSFSFKESEGYSFPYHSFLANNDHKRKFLVDIIKINKVEFDPEHGVPIIKIGTLSPIPYKDIWEMQNSF